MGELPRPVRLLVAVLGAGGLSATAWHLPSLATLDRLGWAVVVLAVLLELARVTLPGYHRSAKATVSLGLVGLFFVLGRYGLGPAVITGGLQAVAGFLWTRSPWYKSLFNCGIMAGLIVPVGEIYLWLLTWLPGEMARFLLAGLVTVTSLFLLQSFLLTWVMSQLGGKAFWRIWRDNYSWLSMQQVFNGLACLYLGSTIGRPLSWIGVPLLMMPVFFLLISYRIYAARAAEYMAQIEAKNESLAQLNQELYGTNRQLIRTLSLLLDARDAFTYGHSAQVTRYARAIGERMGVQGRNLEVLSTAAQLHDIGKVGIPENILFKPGKLTPEERAVMQEHPVIGFRIVSEIQALQEEAHLILLHHEWYGGGGYPNNLKGEDIPLGARIISVCDALETIISDRPYRAGRPLPEALAELRRFAGTQFDPVVVQVVEELAAERGPEFFQNSALVAAAPWFSSNPLAVASAAAGKL